METNDPKNSVSHPEQKLKNVTDKQVASHEEKDKVVVKQSASHKKQQGSVEKKPDDLIEKLVAEFQTLVIEKQDSAKKLSSDEKHHDSGSDNDEQKKKVETNISEEKPASPEKQHGSVEKKKWSDFDKKQDRGSESQLVLPYLDPTYIPTEADKHYANILQKMHEDKKVSAFAKKQEPGSESQDNCNEQNGSVENHDSMKNEATPKTQSTLDQKIQTVVVNGIKFVHPFHDYTYIPTEADKHYAVIRQKAEELKQAKAKKLASVDEVAIWEPNDFALKMLRVAGAVVEEERRPTGIAVLLKRSQIDQARKTESEEFRK